MNEEDPWADVPLGRRAETRRRIAVLDRYIALVNPTEQDKQGAIQDLGIGRASFYRMVRVWRSHRRPALLPGAAGRADGGGRGRKLDSRVETIILEAISRLGASTAPKDLEAEVARLCTAAGIKPPSAAPIARLRREALLANTALIEPVLDELSVVIDSCALDLPPKQADRDTLPVVTAAFLQPEGWIVGYSVRFGPPSLNDALALTLPMLAADTGTRSLVLHPEDNPSWATALAAMTGVGVPPMHHVHGDYGAVFSRIAGATLGGLPLAARSTRLSASVKLTCRADNDEAALGQIAEAISIHNEARGAPSTLAAIGTFRFDIGPMTSALIDVIRWLQAMPAALRRNGLDMSDVNYPNEDATL